MLAHRVGMVAASGVIALGACSSDSSQPDGSGGMAGHGTVTGTTSTGPSGGNGGLGTAAGQGGDGGTVGGGTPGGSPAAGGNPCVGGFGLFGGSGGTGGQPGGGGYGGDAGAGAGGAGGQAGAAGGAGGAGGQAGAAGGAGGQAGAGAAGGAGGQAGAGAAGGAGGQAGAGAAGGAGGAGGGSSWTCGDALVDARDGRSYGTSSIGSQCWMAQNLDVGTMVASTVTQSNNGVAEKYCYGNQAAYCDTYGGLYQWNEMMDYAPSDAGNPSTTRGLCPQGWHVPSDEEWKSLEVALGMTVAEANLANVWRGAGVGTALKIGGSSGYEALLSGRCTVGPFDQLGLYEFMHSSTESGSTYAWRRCVRSISTDVGRFDTFPKVYALSVRCARDAGP